MDTSLLCRTLTCWNKPTVVEAGKFAHLTVRAKWIDGRCIIVAREVKDAVITGLENLKCEVALDGCGGGWIVIIVPGPCEIPAKAQVSVRIVADIATPMWLAELREGKTWVNRGLDKLAKALDTVEDQLL